MGYCGRVHKSSKRDFHSLKSSLSQGEKENAGGKERMAPWMGLIQPVLECFLMEIPLWWR